MRTGQNKSHGSGRRIALVSLIGVTLIGGCFACAANGAKPDSPKPNSADQLYHWRGFTVWSCNQEQPVVYIRAPVEDAQYRATLAHEMSHASMALSFPSCQDYHEWRAEPENELTLEALAQCASLRQRVRDGETDPEEYVEAAVQSLVRGYGLEGLTEERARKRLMAVCR